MEGAWRGRGVGWRRLAFGYEEAGLEGVWWWWWWYRGWLAGWRAAESVVACGPYREEGGVLDV